MGGSRRGRSEALAALGALAATAGAAHAQETAAEAFGQGVVYVEADEVVDERESGRYVARGAVEARYGDRTLRANEVVYYFDEARVVARGDVVVIAPDGSVTYAEEVELADDLTEGVITGFSARLANDGKVGAAFALRTEDGNELARAYYTACEPCADADGQDRPSWRLKARRIRQDQKSQMIFYRDMILEVKGVPVAYLPFFAHADPSSKRRSGFLMPGVGETSRTGAFYEQPYYWAISDHQDLTIAPRYMASANPLLSLEHQKRFFSGATVFNGSITYEDEFLDDENVDDDTRAADEEDVRGHLFGEGRFRIDDAWSWGFGVEAVTEDQYFDRYEIDDTDKQRGLYRRGDKRLLNQAFATRDTRDSYASVAVLKVQGLRGDDDPGLLPLVRPLAEARRTFTDPLFGGGLETRASLVSLERDEGVDSSRASVEVEWRKRLVFKNGMIATPFAVARGDLYDVADFETDAGEPINETFVRGLGYGGAEFSWPFGRVAGPLDLLVEPVAMVVGVPTGINDERIPNEDSLVFDLDQASLLATDRSPGFDVVEEGSRATLGGRAVAQWGEDGGEASLFLGQSYRTERSDQFTAASGLDDRLSDLIGEAEFALNRSNAVTARFRLDNDDQDIQRVDVNGRFRLGRARLSGRYLRVNEDFGLALEEDVDRREEAKLAAGLELTRNFGVYYEATRDLVDDETRRAFTGLVWNDECTRIELVYKQDFTEDRTVGSGDSIRLQVTLSTLGSVGQRR
ncbi:MAG: LPS assembly protein LptD [Caulobacterales bacterium]|nr:LPS assembly protein LptD [Caulobacterales bacterium]